MQDNATHEQNQETVALLKILQLGTRQIATGRVQPADSAMSRLPTRRPGADSVPGSSDR